MEQVNPAAPGLSALFCPWTSPWKALEGQHALPMRRSHVHGTLPVSISTQTLAHHPPHTHLILPSNFRGAGSDR